MNVIVFGTGGFYQKYKEQLIMKGINIIAFTDNDLQKWGTFFEEKPVISPSEIKQIKYYDYIIVASVFWMAIEAQLLQMGIEKDKIWIPFMRKIIPQPVDDLNKIEIKRLIDKRKVSNRKILSIIIENGLSLFIDRFIEYWEKDYDVFCFKLDVLAARKYLNEIMLHSDLCFFEWGGEVLAYGSNLREALEKPIICRIHRYEVFQENIKKINWTSIDKIVFIAEHVRSLFMSQINAPIEKTTIIYNGIDSRKFAYRKRTHGFKLAYLGALKYEKGTEMLLQIIKKLVEIDCRYKLYLAGKVYNKEIEVYFNYMLQEMGLQNNVNYDGFQENIDQWLEDKDYIICSSIVEGHITAVQEAMLKGIKPIIHNYPGAKELYGPEHLWNTIDEAVELITKSPYNSKDYHDLIYDKCELLYKAEEFKELFKEYMK